MISQGVNFPAGLALAHSNSLFVANEYGNTVTVYASKTRDILRTISQSVNDPVALAFRP